MVMGGLRSRGIRVPCQRVIDAMRIVDPVSQIIRQHVTTFRRVYSVRTIVSGTSTNIHVYFICVYMHNSLLRNLSITCT